MEKLELLRQAMASHNMDAYLIVTDDFHGSEYVGDYFKEREFMSGFTGSAGSLVVLKEEAAIFTDGRYFLQAEEQLKGSGILLMKAGEPGVPTLPQYLADKLCENAVIGFDGRTLSYRMTERIREAVWDKNITFSGNEDLVDAIWKERPALSKEPVREMTPEFAGKTRTEKMEEIRQELRKSGADFLLLTALDEIAWLLNLRGHDVEYTPVFLAFMLIEEREATLFVQEKALPEEVRGQLSRDGIAIKPYDTIYEALSNLPKERKVWYDSGTANYRIAMSIQNGMDMDSPVIIKKAIKNSTEISHIREAHIKDGIAVCRFMHWLKETVPKEKLTELMASEGILGFRKQMDGFLEPSFTSIIAYGAHGAIVHYEPTKESDAVIENHGLCLCDTGGQYVDGTTDVTRTFVMGELTQEERHAYTLVLKGHIQLARAVFPEGTCGANLDVLAREPLWREGLDYNHGTGHGVGYLLNVHEGPQRFHWRVLPGVKQATLEPGMIISDEPGLYFAGKFGIRHENLILVTRTEKSGLLAFEPLTLVPFDRDGLDVSMLATEELEWLDNYHEMVYRTLSPRMSEEERIWLRQYTDKIVP